jgi:hypothetical protein
MDLQQIQLADSLNPGQWNARPTSYQSILPTEDVTGY